MMIEYRDDIKFGQRMVALAMAAFLAFLGIFLSSYFGIFSNESRELVTSIILGDMTRFHSFFGFLVVFLCVVILPSIMVIAGLYTAFLSPSHVTNIDTDRRLLTCNFDRPWKKPYRRSYGFDELSIKIIDGDERTRIKLNLPDRWAALTLISESNFLVAEKKFQRLAELGLPIERKPR